MQITEDERSFMAFKPRHAVLLLALVALVRLLLLGAYPLIETTEARYGEIPREMLVSGNWVTPQLDPGVPFKAKPPLSFWLSAISMQLFGVNAFAVRLPSLFLAGAMVGLIYLLARRLYSQQVALFSALILASTGLFYFLAGGVMTDPALATCITLSLVAFPLAAQAPGKVERWIWGYVFFAGLGLSMLAKGPVGVVLTLAPVGMWVLWTRQFGLLWRSLPWISGTVLAAAICVPWYLMAEANTPGFLKYFLWGEHVQRYIDPGWDGDKFGQAHEHMLGTIWLFFAGAALPWGVLLVGALVWLRGRGATLREALRESWLVYLVAWVLAAPMFFSIAHNIMITYCLPALPALAVVIAIVLQRAERRLSEGPRPWFLSSRVQGAAFALCPLLMLIAGTAILPEVAEEKSQKDLVGLLEKSDKDRNGRFVFFDEISNSADFYSGGRAIQMSEKESSKALKARLNDGTKDYYAIEKGDLKMFRRIASHHTKKVGERGEYTLFKEVESHRKPVS